MCVRSHSQPRVIARRGGWGGVIACCVSVRAREVGQGRAGSRRASCAASVLQRGYGGAEAMRWLLLGRARLDRARQRIIIFTEFALNHDRMLSPKTFCTNMHYSICKLEKYA